MKPVITFTPEAKEFILSAFNKELDSAGFIIDSTTKDLILTKSGNKLHVSKFAGISKELGCFDNSFESILALID